MEKQGCYYLQIFYPSNLFLEDGSYYEFVFNQQRIVVLITKHLKSLMINDFDNKIARVEGDGTEFQPIKNDIQVSDKSMATVLEDDKMSASFLIDYGKHFHKEYYHKSYTEVIVSFEANKSDKNIEIGLNVLDYFINNYRVIANDILTLTLNKMPYVARIVKDYFHQYTEEELRQEHSKRMKVNRGLMLGIRHVRFPFWNTDGKKFDTDPKANTKSLKDLLLTGTKTDVLSDFMLKAREEHFIHTNYKYSFIESWTSMEIGIVRYLKQKKLEKGISKNKLKDFESEVGISYLLNIELPLVCNYDEKLKSIISKVDTLRKIRNKMIHENKEISELESSEALSTAVELLSFLGYKKY